MISNVVTTSALPPTRLFLPAQIFRRSVTAAQGVQPGRDDLNRLLDWLLHPVRPERGERLSRIDNLAAHHREQRFQRTKFVRRNIEIVLVEHSEIGEAAGLQRAPPVIVEGEPGA